MQPRGFNWQIWAGAVLTPVALFSYPMLFVKHPLTRNVPWVNVLLFLAAFALLYVGLRRAFAPGSLRAVRIVGSLALSAFGLLVFAMFVQMAFIAPRDLPTSVNAPQVGAHAPDFNLLDEDGKAQSLAALLSSPIPGTAQSPKGLLLIFYMYSGCRACNSEFHGIQQELDRFTARGLRPVAISIDEPGTSKQLSQEAGYTFTFLSDPKLDVIRRYDLNDGDMGARPAEFLLDPSGVVRWRNLTDNYYVRAEPDQILKAAKALD